MRAPSCRGFSLVEMMLVIAILAVVMTLLLPSLRAARDVARRTLCSSNMRQHGMMLAMYAGDTRGWIPQPGSRHQWGQGGGRLLGGMSFVHLRTGNNTSCPEGMQTQWNRVTPAGLGWFFWMGYMPPMGVRNRQRGIWECPDVMPGLGASPTGTGNLTESAWRDVQYNNNNAYTTQMARQQLFPATNINPEGANWDCQPHGGGNYFHRGWFGARKHEGLRPNQAVIVDGERQLYSALLDGRTNYSDPHGNGINLLFNDGSAKFAAKDLSGRKPHVYFSMVSEGRTFDQALTANSPSSGLAYAGNGALTALWNYYDAQ